MILTGVVGVSAANTLTSNGVLYSNAGSSVTTVEGALNELYANYNSLLAKGNASASEILSGKTALVGGKEVTGTMPIRSGSSQAMLTSPGTHGLYMVFPYGYYPAENHFFQDDTSEVYISNSSVASAIGLTANKLLKGQNVLGIEGTATSDATATASQILSGKTAYVNGNKVTGTMVDRGTAQNTGGLGCFPGGCGTGESQYYALNNIPEGYYHKDGLTWAPEIRVNANQMREALGITADKIAAGQTIAGVTGTYSVTSTTAQYLGYGNTATVKVYDCTSISGYQNLTKDNFVPVPSGLTSYTTSNPKSTTRSFTYSYNASTGKLTVNQSELVVGTTVVTLLYDMYYVPIKVVR